VLIPLSCLCNASRVWVNCQSFYYQHLRGKMDKLLPFVQNHYILVTFFVITVILLIVVEGKRQGAGTFRISPNALVRMINHHDAYVVDLRDPGAYKKGHIQSAVSIPWSDFQNHQKQLEKHRERTIVFVCQNGQNSVRALTQLRKQGFKHLHVLNGGQASWNNANLPLTAKGS
jgi:rhodanese-related sulfurtransferase